MKLTALYFTLIIAANKASSEVALTNHSQRPTISLMTTQQQLIINVLIAIRTVHGHK
jgi:hypothetical protein